MTPQERAQQIRQDSQRAHETEEFLMLAAAELLRDLAQGRRHPITGEYRPRTGREPLFTVATASDYLGFHPTTIKEMAQNGRLQGRKVGREWRFTQEQLDAIKPARKRRARVERSASAMSPAPQA